MVPQNTCSAVARTVNHLVVIQWPMNPATKYIIFKNIIDMRLSDIFQG